MLSREGCIIRTNRWLEWCRANRVDLTVVMDAKNIYYLTGFLRQSYGWLIARVSQLACFTDGHSILLCSKSERRLLDHATVAEAVTYQDYNIQTTTQTYLEHALVPLQDALRHHKTVVERIAIEKRYMPVAVLELLQGLYPKAEFLDISETLLRFRRRKDADEVTLLRKTAAITGVCYARAAEVIAAGKTEVDIYAACNETYAKTVGSYVTFSGDFVSGENALKTGGPPTDRILQRGESMILDLWIDPAGYWIDNARSFVVGNHPSPELNKIYDLVITALEAGERLLRPGTRGKDVYYEVKRVFTAAGYGEYFPLHAGHGLGLSPHEAPLLIPGSDDVLEEGMVCTLEPGLYVPGIGGVRCEDNYVVRSAGPERLTMFPRKMNWD